MKKKKTQSNSSLMRKTCALKDGDYLLKDGAAWLEVDGFSIRVARTDEGVAVDIYKNGHEMEDAIASTYAFTSEL